MITGTDRNVWNMVEAFTVNPKHLPYCFWTIYTSDCLDPWPFYVPQYILWCTWGSYTTSSLGLKNHWNIPFVYSACYISRRRECRWSRIATLYIKLENIGVPHQAPHSMHVQGKKSYHEGMRRDNLLPLKSYKRNNWRIKALEIWARGHLQLHIKFCE